jgi:cystathionine beta-lyase family protein involved in aluminum resistance
MENYNKYSRLICEAEREISSALRQIDETVLENQARVLEAFCAVGVDESCFYESTGYGYHDIGREKLDSLFARVFGAQSGLVRPQFVSGTHAIVCSLYGILQRGNHVLSLTGQPYDTLQKALGLNTTVYGGLQDLGVRYSQADFTEGLDEQILDRELRPDTQVVLLQRSRGYGQRRALTVDNLAVIIGAVKERRPDITVFVDNCYGEFVQPREPCHVGADLVAGSLIKNPGAGLVPGGGYVVGRHELVEKAAWRLTAPGLGMDIGAMGHNKRLYYQGLFLAPHQVGQALKGMTLVAAVFSRLGYDVFPRAAEERGDIVQAIRLGSPEKVKGFCRAVQAASPVDSHLTPEPAPMVGYNNEIIMAAGTFIQGASSEFSADAPLRPPYDVFMQGGLTYEHIKLALAHILASLGK